MPLLKLGPLNNKEQEGFDLIKHAILNLNPPPFATDTREWKLTPNKTFTVKSLYHFRLDGGTRSHLKNRFWKQPCPLKVKLFAWLAKEDRILTLDNLHKRNWRGERTRCYLCETEDESVTHLLTSCPLVVQIWNHFGRMFGLRTSGFETHALWGTRAALSGVSNTLRGGWDLVVMAITWSVWQDKQRVCLRIIRDITFLLISWLDAAPPAKRLKLETTRNLVKRSLEFTLDTPRQANEGGNVFEDDPPPTQGMIQARMMGYPNPSEFTYERRLFCPFEYALQPPSWYKVEHIAVDKPELPFGISELKQYDGPQSFIIPGNHDWFDGLHTFMRYICHKSWLGGWFLPQKKSYFALQLPKGWWIFGLDQALHGDIDVYQFKFFAKLCQSKVGENDSVIIMTHEPNWLLDWYWNDVSGKNVSHLICEYLKGRCKLRLAGDLHHYMRHSFVPSDKPVHVQHLLVNGCGGAFLHPTHVFKNFNKFYGASYESKAAYPSYDDSSRIALGNILKFRKKNWQFDIIGGVIYFVLVFSMLPQCNLFQILREDSWSGRLMSFFRTMWGAFIYMLESSHVSLVGTLTLIMASIFFVPPKLSRKKRIIIGVLHVFAHLTAAIILMLLLELSIEICIRNRLLATSGYHTLYEWYRSMEREHFPDPTGLRARIEQWTFGLYPACIKYLMSAFDVPEVMAVTRSSICKKGMGSLSRSGATIYFASVFLYFWVLSTPVVSLIFGSYLYICINWFHIHFDEAFSSLRIANYKSFTRFHITGNGDLEVFTLAVDKIPKDWKLDPKWDSEPKRPLQLSHHRKYPSKWSAASTPDPINTVRIVDHFVIQGTPTNTT